MGENLVTNGGFEAEWGDEQNRDTWVCGEGIAPYLLTPPAANTLVPPGWQFWFTKADGLHLPECRDTRADGRYCEGAKGFMYFKSDAPYIAGLWQRVEIPDKGFVTVFLRSEEVWGFRNGDSYWDDVALTLDGDTFTLTAWAHAWSNHAVAGFEHVGDARCSVAPPDRCCGSQFWWEGDAPPLTGDPLSDAISNFTFHVGLDVYGGTDPYAATVLWGRGAHIYNGYSPLTVQVPASWRGKPREQYERTYVLLPPNAGAAWARAAVDGSWDRRRFTVGGSADDAGIGDLDARRVIAVNPQNWPGPQTLLDFFTEYYPGVAYVPVEAATPAELQAQLGGM